MKVRVLFFGVLKDLIGRSSEELTLPDQAKAGDVIEHYGSRDAVLKDMLGATAISVNQEYARSDAKLKAGDEIALLPPVSGGTARARITREVIDSAHVAADIRQPQDGAVAIFEGIVRNHSHGRRTRFLEYEAYEDMAHKQMESLADQALSQFQIRDVAIVHRLGHLEIGETSVMIVVASAHRAAAFDACRWLIDTLKRTVPIWKKEFFEDGAVWADGEPFPQEIAPGATGSHSRSSASK
jgi:molybdopterin converting factor subunit 1